MSLLKRREVNSAMEEKILTGMIISDSFCRDIIKITTKEIFAVSYISRVAQWCKDYYKKYKQAPGLQISDIFEVEKDKIEEEADQKAISLLLSNLSEEYENSEAFNEEYLKDRALEYFRERNIKLANDRATAFIQLGRIDEAEKVFDNYKKTALLTSRWENPFDPEIMKNYFADAAAQKDLLFELSGDIGKFIGPLKRNWLVGILAPTKKGKTWWLIELAIQAAFNKRKAVFISLEMSHQQIYERIYKRLTSMSPVRKEYLFPCFDCLKNQTNQCNKAIRVNNRRLLNEDDGKPKFTRELQYRPCTVCRGTKDFFVATWFQIEKKERMSPNQAMKMIKAQGTHFGKNLEVMAYPSYSANISQIQSDLSILEEAKNFVPDLVVLDYADILAPENAKVTGRDRIDETWKTLKQMGDIGHGCVATASQSNRQSFDKRNVVQTDAAEDIRKIAHSNLFLAINQTPQEKKECCSRISKIALRDGGFDQYEGAVVLQHLGLGQPLLDSYRSRYGPFDEIDDLEMEESFGS